MKQKRTSKRTKPNAWFIRVRGSYLPASRTGWLTYIPYLGYDLLALGYVLSRHYDFWLSLLILVPNWVAAAAVMNWLAVNKS